ncbi:peptide/nickel transport system substrate-binding protein [Thermosyntropha lipolytica DSM 11003]|uniref:Peptide/nickel transport system substrate-binding protein n=1 Tax=Thermosyntropha lipolytica DSM 11003 TaxID=1123382 RepID=A0A1M5MZE8_9FIRM|nr:ABC transporter substrate-binding protein [Thermosyntropha lipolytica]SHG82641.1 peptide/nickel transport system substrate-binding protein [Thermosyntropha lipolytica DSM 11003]
MYIKFRQAAVITSFLGLFILIIGIVWAQNRIISVSNLEERPFNVGVVGNIYNISPPLFSSPEEKMIASAMYEGLVCYDEESQSIRPNLAVNWKYANDGKSLLLYLKPDVRFHNGKIFTAYDVKKSFENSFINTKEVSDMSMFLSIAGSEERLKGKSTEISGIEVINKYTVRVRFKEPNSAFIFMLTNPVFYIYDLDDKVKVAPGTGPFMFKEDKDGSIILVKNEKYHRQEPRISVLNIRWFKDPYSALNEYKAGKLDYLDKVPLPEIKNLKAGDEYKGLWVEKKLFATYCIGFNLHREPFMDNYQLRRAVNYAIDRKAIIENVLAGSCIPLKGVVPEGLGSYRSEMWGYTYDPDKAKKLLAEAGYPEGKGLPPLILSYNLDEGHRMVAESIAQQLGNIGIQVRMRPLEWGEFKKGLQERDFVFFRLGWYADYPDADNFLYSMFHSKMIGLTNYTGYYNPQVDKLLNAARAEVKSNGERIKLLKRAEEIITDDAACLFLFQNRKFALKGKEVNNLKLDSMGMLNWHEIELLKPIGGEKT